MTGLRLKQLGSECPQEFVDAEPKRIKFRGGGPSEDDLLGELTGLQSGHSVELYDFPRKMTLRSFAVRINMDLTDSDIGNNGSYEQTIDERNLTYTLRRQE